MTFKLEDFDVQKFDSILARGLSHGLGKQGEKVCIEAAICETLGLPHGDDPGCVGDAVRAFKIQLNDSAWSSEKARADGLRLLGIAQLGSKGVVDDAEFSRRLAEKVIRVLLPKLFRQIFPNNSTCLEAADRCEKEGNQEAAAWAARAAEAARAASEAASEAAWAAARAAEVAGAAVTASAAAWAARAAEAARAASEAAWAAARAARAAARAAEAARADSDEYLNLAAKLCLEVLQEMKSPGVILIKP